MRSIIAYMYLALYGLKVIIVANKVYGNEVVEGECRKKNPAATGNRTGTSGLTHQSSSTEL